MGFSGTTCTGENRRSRKVVEKHRLKEQRDAKGCTRGDTVHVQVDRQSGEPEAVIRHGRHWMSDQRRRAGDVQKDPHEASPEGAGMPSYSV